jgi:hypothetical protein
VTKVEVEGLEKYFSGIKDPNFGEFPTRLEDIYFIVQGLVGSRTRFACLLEAGGIPTRAVGYSCRVCWIRSRMGDYLLQKSV